MKRLGTVKAETSQKLGVAVVEHLGLGLVADENVGKQARFIDQEKLKYEGYQGEFKIVGRQKMWGHNAEGKYVPNMEGYRLSNGEDSFGVPALPTEIEIIK